MTQHWRKALAAAIVVPLALALAACLFVPGRFQSTLTIKADRSFTFTYKGEVVAMDLEGMMGKGLSDLADSDDEADGENKKPSTDADKAKKDADKRAEKDAEYRALADQVRKEAGYSLVEYRGDGVFYVEYALSGKLTHNFLFPYNQDAEMIFPFVAVELRGKDGVRVKAPAFAKQQDSGKTMGAGDQAASKLDGSFTLITDAQIVSQNNEDGATSVPGGKSITWKVNARSADAPMAMLKVAGL
ncbi:hypothetical protein ACG3SL_01545 [Sphingomonas sp. CJ20]